MSEPKATRPVAFYATPAAGRADALIGATSHAVVDEFSQATIAICFNEADAKRVAEALNNAAGRAAMAELTK